MYRTRSVHHLQHKAHLCQASQALAGRAARPALEQRLEGSTGAVLHRDQGERLVKPVDCDDLGVLQGGGDARLAKEQGARGRIPCDPAM